MTCKALIDYLSGFNPDEHVRVVALNLDARLAYKPDSYSLLTGAGFPAILFELGEAAPMDEVVEEAHDAPAPEKDTKEVKHGIKPNVIARGFTAGNVCGGER